MNVSAIVLTHNSKDLIDECLKSLLWVKEVIVVDDNSSDSTKESVSRYAKAIFVEGKHSFSDNRNIGARKARGGWLLYVDDDERVTPELKKEIEKIGTDYCAYAIPRKNYIFKKEFKHSGQYPDYVKRVFEKENFIKWMGELHEEPEFKGKLGHLRSPLIHKKHDNLSDMVTKTNEWSEIEAKLMFNESHPPMTWWRFFSVMFREFWLRMIKQVAFLDGTEGVIYAIYQVFSRSVSYAKLWELQLEDKKRNIKQDI